MADAVMQQKFEMRKVRAVMRQNLMVLDWREKSITNKSDQRMRCKDQRFYKVLLHFSDLRVKKTIWFAPKPECLRLKKTFQSLVILTMLVKCIVSGPRNNHNRARLPGE